MARAEFAALEDAISDACDGLYGESYEWQPMLAAPGGGRREPDSSRPVRRLVAIHDEPSIASKSLGDVIRTASQVTTTRPSINVDVRRLGGGGLPRRFDRLLRLDTGIVYEVNDVKPDGEGRVACAVDRVPGA